AAVPVRWLVGTSWEIHATSPCEPGPSTWAQRGRQAPAFSPGVRIRRRPPPIWANLFLDCVETAAHASLFGVSAMSAGQLSGTFLVGLPLSSRRTSYTWSCSSNEPMTTPGPSMLRWLFSHAATVLVDHSQSTE